MFLNPQDTLGALPDAMSTGQLPSTLRDLPTVADFATIGELRAALREDPAFAEGGIQKDPAASGSYEAGTGTYDPNPAAPTEAQYGAFATAFKHFNAALFEGKLPDVILAFATHKKSYGYFIASRWRSGESDVRVGEIALNPDFLERTERDVAATIVHEMVHLWQHAFGRPSRRGYHNAQWADRMEAIGLMPSATGEPGGARVGQRMTHYVIEGGRFAQAFDALPSKTLLPFVAGAAIEGARGPKKARDPSKTPYVCGTCGLKVWAKAGVVDLVHCGGVMSAA